MDSYRVLIADDHEEFRHGLEALLAATPAIEVVGTAADGALAVAMALPTLAWMSHAKMTAASTSPSTTSVRSRVPERTVTRRDTAGDATPPGRRRPPAPQPPSISPSTSGTFGSAVGGGTTTVPACWRNSRFGSQVALCGTA